jgi:hypothetical protein
VIVQLIPAGLDVTVPFPFPVPTTVSVGLLPIVIDSCRVAVCPPEATSTVNVSVCSVVGVPLIPPPLDRLRPAGRLPLDRLHVFVPLPPVACSVWLYAVPI